MPAFVNGCANTDCAFTVAALLHVHAARFAGGAGTLCVNLPATSNVKQDAAVDQVWGAATGWHAHASHSAERRCTGSDLQEQHRAPALPAQSPRAAWKLEAACTVTKSHQRATSGDTSGEHIVHSSSIDCWPHLQPRILAPHATRPGDTPRKVLVHRCDERSVKRSSSMIAAPLQCSAAYACMVRICA